MITYVLVALLAVSILSLVSYYFSINLLYKKNYKRSINIKNQFSYEVVPQKGENQFFINVLLVVSLLAFLASTIMVVVNFFGVADLVISIASLFLAFVVIALPFINIKYLKEHLYLDIAMVVLFFLINGLLTYLSYSMCKIYDYKNTTGIAALVISALLLLTAFIFFINPKLFNLKGEEQEDGTVRRPKVIHLALVEWLVMFLTPLEILPLLLLSMIM